MSTTTPSGDVYVTARSCPVCGLDLPVGRSRRFCSPACRQAAYRRRHQPLTAPQIVLPPRRSRLHGTVYECPQCESRYLAEQWCPDCSLFCRRLGPGGPCPSCDEMITAQEIADSIGAGASLADHEKTRPL